MTKKLIVPFLGVLLCMQFASAETFTSSAAFFAAVPRIQQTENFEPFFEGNGPLADGQDFVSGVGVGGLGVSNFVLTGGATELTLTNLYNSFSGLSLGVDHGTDKFFFGGEGATFNVNYDVTAVGMFFNVNLNSGSYGFSTPVGNATTDSASYDTDTFVFVGLFSPTPFSTITFSSTDPNLGSYTVAEVVLGESDGSPEPSTVSLVLAGILSLAAFGLKRRFV